MTLINWAVRPAFHFCRLGKCLREDFVCVPETGTACQTGKHHEGNKLTAGQFIKDTICSLGPELVSLLTAFTVVLTTGVNYRVGGVGSNQNHQILPPWTPLNGW